jgi:hypothetical protein
VTTNTTPQAAEAARLAEEAISQMERGNFNLGCTYIDRLRDLASRADPVGERVLLDEFLAAAERDGVTHLKDPAVEAKPTAAEMTGEAWPEVISFAGSWNSISTLRVRLRPGADETLFVRATPSASPSEAQKAVAPMDFALLVASARNVVKTWQGYAPGPTRWEMTAAVDELSGTLGATHPPAGAGVPQEVAMLTPEQIDELPLPREPDHYEKLAFATAIQRTLAAAWGIRLKGDDHV